MTDELISYLAFAASSASGQRAVELRLARVRDVSGLLDDDREGDLPDRAATWLRPLLLLFVHRLDGERFHYDRLDAVLGDAELVREIVLRIRALLDTFRERGRIFVLCPGCMTWEAEMSFTGYALTIAERLPSSFDGQLFTVASLAARAMKSSRRPPIRRTARIRFEAPSAVLGLQREIQGGILGQINYQDGEDEPPLPAKDEDEEHEENDDEIIDLDELQPVWGGAGWRALTRLAEAIDPHLTVEALGRLPAFDFFFLELLYYVTAIAKVNDDTAGKLTCPTCGTTFLPVREDWKRPR